MSYRVGLVCSAGGHLAQLFALRPWWAAHDRFWVCLDKPDARELLDGERVYWAGAPTNRSVRRTLALAALATGVLGRERPDVLVSNGAAVAVPFFVVGKALGARLVWIEVPDRVDRASLTGRLVRGWVDRIVLPHAAQRGLPGRRGDRVILFTVGTHEQPFDRLVVAAGIAARSGERVVVQRGTSRVAPVGCEVHDHLDRAAFDGLLGSARIVVSHAGPSTLDRVLARGRLPIVVPRDPTFGEHVDDHQIRYGRWLADRLHVVPDPARLPHAIAGHPALEVDRSGLLAGLRLGWADGDARTAAAFAAVVEDLVRPDGDRVRGLRATLARLLCSPRR